MFVVDVSEDAVADVEDEIFLNQEDVADGDVVNVVDGINKYNLQVK